MDLVDFNYNCKIKSSSNCGINTNKKQMKKTAHIKRINYSIFPALSYYQMIRCCC